MSSIIQKQTGEPTLDCLDSKAMGTKDSAFPPEGIAPEISSLWNQGLPSQKIV